MQTAEIVMKQSSTPIVKPATAPAGIKTILFHVHSDDGLANRIEVALSIARAFGAHVQFLHVTPIEAYTVTDAFSVFVSPQIMAVLEDESAKLREKLQQQLANEDVSWSYEDVTGEMMRHLIQNAALADLVVTGRQPHEREFGGPGITLIGDMLHSIRTPLLVVGDDASKIDPFGPAIVAWNGSYEAANALRAALPLLKIASYVRLVTVEEKKGQQFPSTPALEYLSRHGVHAELSERPRVMDTVEQEILAQAAIDGASYIVMGGYSHSRAGQFLFGGVTRSLLKKCSVPLFVTR
ncbi:MAG TPA: universal stress protein [Sphingomicrobium sp.]|nr:universal stress protein [Sphingomicrobium sp.]